MGKMKTKRRSFGYNSEFHGVAIFRHLQEGKVMRLHNPCNEKKNVITTLQFF